MNKLIDKLQQKIREKYYADTHNSRIVQRNFYRKIYWTHVVILAPLLCLVAIILNKIIPIPLELLAVLSFVTALAASDHMAKKRSYEKFEMTNEEENVARN